MRAGSGRARKRYSSVGKVTNYAMGKMTTEHSQVPYLLLFSKTCRPVLRVIQPLFQWSQKALSHEVKKTDARGQPLTFI
jgi:hypothetical protein